MRKSTTRVRCWLQQGLRKWLEPYAGKPARPVLRGGTASNGRSLPDAQTDQRLVHELLQTDFGGRFQVDRERVFLWGGSQGACFLNDFVPRYGEHYGGGLYIGCGCFSTRNPLWKPSEEFKRRFRVFVQATTEDFVYSDTVDAYGYYRYTVGLDTRGDLAGAGGHCARGEVSATDALNWLINGTGLPDEPEHAHLKRVSLLDFAVGITVDPDGALWVARQLPGSSARLWRSIDRGTSFHPVSRIGMPISDFDAVDNALLATRRGANSSAESLYRSMDQGSTFKPLSLKFVPLAGRTIADRHGRVFLAGYSGGALDVYASRDLGDSWMSLGYSGPLHHRLANTGPLVGEEPEDFVFVGAYSDVLSAGTTEGEDWNDVSRSPNGGHIQTMAWDGDKFWALADHPRSLYSSNDRGLTWTAMPQPQDDGVWVYPTQLNSLDHRQVFVIAYHRDGYLRNVDGEWSRIFGSGSFKDPSQHNHQITFDHNSGDVYLTANSGIFRLDGGLRSVDLPNIRSDSDSDGIPDVLDQFPDDSSESLDTDGDGLGNNRDDDDDGDGVHDNEDQVPLDPDETVDLDGDGIGNNDDVDIDGDGTRNLLDAFPLDRSETADSDRDGTGDAEDNDDDADGVPDSEDAFRLYPGEWRDTDGDGIGDNVDLDDDGDGRPDIYDPAPLVGKPAGPSLQFGKLFQFPGSCRSLDSSGQEGAGNVRYPPSEGTLQWFGEIQLGDGYHPPVHLMVDSLGGHVGQVYIDRNGNADLSDDGPPIAAVGNAAVTPIVEIAYRTGAVVPYSFGLYFRFTDEGTVSHASLCPDSNWHGDVTVVGGAHVAVIAHEANPDGIFDGTIDYLCVDVDRDGILADCLFGSERFSHSDLFVLDGREVQVFMAASGHRWEIGSPMHPVPFFPAESHPDWQGFVQITNRSDEDGEVEIRAFDDDGTAYEPLTPPIGAHATKFFNSKDLEQGNSEKELSGGIGEGEGAWRLELSSDLDLDVLAYVRTGEGFLTRMHDMAHRDATAIHVPTFNPGSNRNQVSVLRLVNPGTMNAEVTIEGVDDDGLSPGGPVMLSVPAGGAREVSAEALEAGSGGLTGALGDGKGKWRLSVMSEKPVRVVSLLQSPTGHVTNLSTQPYEDGGPLHQVSMFPAASDAVREGFARVVNHSDEPGEVLLFAYDDSGARHGPVTLAINAGATVHLNSKDLEQGNASKGLGTGTGPGNGDWWLEFETDLDLQVLGYVRTEDGFLTDMHNAFHRGEGGIHVPTFNPGRNMNQVSLLRLVNPGDDERRVAITGVDSGGVSPGSTVHLSVPPRGARTITSLELESGSPAGLTGALGTGQGKWQLTVEPDGPLRVMSLLQSPTGHLTNLSTMPERFPSRQFAIDSTVLAEVSVEEAIPATTPLRVHRAHATADSEPNSVVIDTETMGKIYFDRNTLRQGGPRMPVAVGDRAKSR